MGVFAADSNSVSSRGSRGTSLGRGEGGVKGTESCSGTALEGMEEAEEEEEEDRKWSFSSSFFFFVGEEALLWSEVGVDLVLVVEAWRGRDGGGVGERGRSTEEEGLCVSGGVMGVCVEEEGGVVAGERGEAGDERRREEESAADGWGGEGDRRGPCVDGCSVGTPFGASLGGGNDSLDSR